MKRFEAQKACLVFMLIMSVFIILPGCGGEFGGGHWNKPVANTAPTVTAVAPLANTNVPRNTKIITASFSKAMAPATLTTASFTLACNGTPITGGGAVTYLAAGNIAMLPLPAADLPSLAACTATITTGAKDQTGIALANDFVWSFTTTSTSDTTQPRVTSTAPVTTNPGPTLGVLTSTPITAVFNKDMAPATITAPGTFTLTGPGTTVVDGAVPAVTYAVGSRTATFHPAAQLKTGTTYTATIKGLGANAATDLTGNPLAGDPALPLVANDYVWTFTTSGSAPPAQLTLLTFGIASAGGITNTGATKINGNVVLDPTATCNLQPILFADGPGFGVCGGNLLNIPTVNAGDQVITQIYPNTTTADPVIAALNVKWNSISPALLPGATVLGCGTIGSTGDAGAAIGCSGNSTLPPGTYISATGTTIGVAGDLTLNGSATDVWTFQAPSALTTAVTSRIILTGGAKASNVWWFVGSSATLNTDTIFQGNILASASISMGTGATSCGRLLAGAEGSGEFTFLGNTVSVPGHPNAPVGCQ